MKVLFVCSGNICRSPMAAEYFRARAADAGLNHIVADSAGLLGIEGEPASLEAIRVMRDAGLDLRAGGPHLLDLFGRKPVRHLVTVGGALETSPRRISSS